MSILDSVERFASLDRSQVTLDPARCLHSIDQFSTCSACFDLCPENAITPGKPPSLNEELCKSCLACLPVCPLGAYKADDEVIHLLNCAPHIEGDSVELVCALNPHPEISSNAEGAAIRVRGCLAGLGSGAYIALSTIGLRRIDLRTDFCSDCTWRSLSNRVGKQADNSLAFLSGWTAATKISCIGTIVHPTKRIFWEANNPPLSRRDLFRMFGQQGKTTLARALDQKQDVKGTQPGRDRRRIIASAKNLPVPEYPEQVDLEPFGFAALEVAETCTACGACARACPTGALSILYDETGGQYSLTMEVSRCVACGICQHVCAPSAIEVKLSPSFVQVFRDESIVLHDGELTKCQRCGTRFAKRENLHLCPICDFRQKNPFCSVLPPGLKLSRPDHNNANNP